MRHQIPQIPQSRLSTLLAVARVTADRVTGDGRKTNVSGGSLYRLAVFPIVIPPLRDRPADVRAFAEYFAERAANRFGVRQVPVSDADVRRLTDYRWPGNVREMAAVMDRAVLVGQGRRLDVAAALGQPTPAPAPQLRRFDGNEPASIDPLDVVISRHIQAALHATHGRIEGPHGAARRLRINPHTLRARMRKLRIDCRAFRTTNEY
jgi:transcriptional regulator with GAF, ATPase, and Fis domain